MTLKNKGNHSHIVYIKYMLTLKLCVFVHMCNIAMHLFIYLCDSID